MTARIIDGKAFAATVRERGAQHISCLNHTHGITPGLAVVLVGDDPASQVYVRSKGSSHYCHPKVTQRPHLLFQIDIRHINSDAKDVTEAAAD